MAHDSTLTAGALPPWVRAGAMPSPLAVRLLLAISAVGFVIYIPVALLRSTAPVLMLDAMLGVALLFTLGWSTPRRYLGGSTAVRVFLALFLISLIPAILIDRPESTMSTIQGLRSTLFGMVMLLVASAWLDTARRADLFMVIFVFGSIFAALYAFRQLIFGLMPFELERLALMGNSGREIETVGRIRVPSTFGDPATFAFFSMLGMCLLITARRRGTLPDFVRKFYKPVLLLLLLGLAMTLTRAPLLGLVCAMMWLYFTSRRLDVRWIANIAGLAVLVITVIAGINYIVVNGVLAESEVPWIRTTNNILSSVWSLIPAAVSGDVGARLENLRGGSATSRIEAWSEGLAFLVQNPLGGGLGAMTEGAWDVITFSTIDVGILRFGMELGWLGMFAMAGLWASVLVVGFRKWMRIAEPRTRELGRGLLATWVAIGAAQSVTSFLHTELIAYMVWMIAALLLNLDRIANSDSSANVLRTSGVRA
jgi:hypothetical protein